MTLQQAKDEVYGKHFDKNGRMWLPTTFEYNKMDDEAAELYAEAKAKEFGEYLIKNLNTENVEQADEYMFSEKYYETFKQSTENCLHEFKLDGNSEIPFDLFCKNCGKKA